MAIAVPLVIFALFLGLYQFLRIRAGGEGQPPPVQWGWLAAIISVAAIALLIGVLTR